MLCLCVCLCASDSPERNVVEVIGRLAVGGEGREGSRALQVWFECVSGAG